MRASGCREICTPCCTLVAAWYRKSVWHITYAYGSIELNFHSQLPFKELKKLTDL